MKFIIKLSFVVITIIFICGFARAQPITWQKDKKLGWQDFKAAHEGKMFEAAKSEFEVRFKYQGASKEGKLEFSFDVNAVFLPEESWCLQDRTSEELLVHEQLHFDITELFARKMRKRFSEANFSADNYDSEIKLLYKKTMTELNNYRAVYNSETFFGAKLDKQLHWNEKVATALAEYTAYLK